jgi:RHS repeat-associated protein
MASVDADPDHDGTEFELNLRRPGQYADHESGTYYNYYRDYDPSLGRYLTSDPLGLAAGSNTYAYVHSDPMNRVDALGLYDEMIHYYMTYFLALAAGIPQDIARTLAIAAQYVDENYLTQPIHALVIPNKEALSLYHFVMNTSASNFGDSSSDPLTRFYNPSSPQLDRLRASTDPEMLQRLWLSLKQNEGACPMPQTIQNARYQLYGEYMHAYEDTFAHRDAYNMPYSVASNPANTPVAWSGHGGIGVPDWFGHAPDHTYNQNYRSPSACTVMMNGEPSTTFNGTREQCAANGGTFYPARDQDETECEVHYALGGNQTFHGLTESQCTARGNGPAAVGATFHPGSGDIWQYNELRTLRMEYELFNMLQTDFAKEIQSNQLMPDHVPTWSDLAGREWSTSDETKNSRIGVASTYEDWLKDQALSYASTALQQYNSSTDPEGPRLQILNNWLREHGFVNDQGKPIQIEEWSALSATGSTQRWENIGWIPRSRVPGILVPRDEPCSKLDEDFGRCRN